MPEESTPEVSLRETSKQDLINSPRDLPTIISDVGEFAEANKNDAETKRQLELFKREVETIRNAYDQKLISGERHDELIGYLMAELHSHSETDDLTGLYRRIAFFKRLEEQASIALRTGIPLTVAFFDLDKFGELNKESTHETGDAALQQSAAHLRSSLRRGSDIAGRYGGDEYTVCLPGMSKQHLNCS